MKFIFRNSSSITTFSMKQHFLVGRDTVTRHSWELRMFGINKKYTELCFMLKFVIEEEFLKMNFISLHHSGNSWDRLIKSKVKL